MQIRNKSGKKYRTCVLRTHHLHPELHLTAAEFHITIESLIYARKGNAPRIGYILVGFTRPLCEIFKKVFVNHNNHLLSFDLGEQGFVPCDTVMLAWVGEKVKPFQKINFLNAT